MTFPTQITRGSAASKFWSGDIGAHPGCMSPHEVLERGLGWAQGAQPEAASVLSTQKKSLWEHGSTEIDPGVQVKGLPLQLHLLCAGPWSDHYPPLQRLGVELGQSYFQLPDLHCSPHTASQDDTKWGLWLWGPAPLIWETHAFDHKSITICPRFQKRNTLGMCPAGWVHFLRTGCLVSS